MVSLRATSAGSGEQQRLIDWADALYRREVYGLRSRIVIARPGRLEVIEALRYLDTEKQDELVQAAAVVARTAEANELVALLTRATLAGASPLGTITPGAPREHSALLIARSAEGERFSCAWHTKPNGRRQIEIASYRLVDAVDTELPDFSGADSWVDPVIEEGFARRGLPGARRGAGSVELRAASVMREEAPEAPGEAVGEDAALEAPPVAAPHPLPAEAGVLFPWGAVGPYADEIAGGRPLFPTGAVPLITSHAARPPRFDERSLDDLLRNGWTSEAQALHVVAKVRREDDRSRTLARVLTSKVPPRAKTYACALAAASWAKIDPAAAGEAAGELVTRVEGEIAEAGGHAAWLAQEWPEHVGTRQGLGIVSIASAACGAYWRIASTMSPEQAAAPDTAAQERALELARSLRDALLDHAGAPPGSPGARVAALGRSVLRVTPSPLGEHRIEKWREALRLPRPRSTPRVMREFAAFHVTSLHTVIQVTESTQARSEALRKKDASGFHPEASELAGLLEPAPLLLARDVVIKAAMIAEKEGSATAPAVMSLLEAARRMAPWDPMILGCWNEARFRRGDRSAALLDDLAIELRDQPSLAAAAEALSIAEPLARPRAARLLAAKAIALAEGTPHAWMAEVRALFTHPPHLARLDRVSDLLARAPTECVPEERGREVFALYGPEPRRAVEQMVTALSAQKDAIEWAALVEELGEDAGHDEAPTAALSEEARIAAWLDDLQRPLRALRPLIAQAGAEARTLGRRAAELERAAGEASDEASRAVIDSALTRLLEEATAQAAGEAEPEPEPSSHFGAAASLEEGDGFRPMQLSTRALERSRRDLGTPEWALQEGLRLLSFYNLARGKRDQKMLQGTRDEAGPLWELRHRDTRHPVRVLYRAAEPGPRVIAILAKQDDAHQRRVIERVRAWPIA